MTRADTPPHEPAARGPFPARGEVTIEVAVRGGESLAAMQLGALLSRARLIAKDVETGYRAGPRGEEVAYAVTSIRHLLTES